MFVVGDYVCTPGGGLGCITATETISGIDCFIIRNEFGVVRKPVAIGERDLREPVDEETARRTLALLVRKPPVLPSTGHKQERYIGSVLRENSFPQLVKLLSQLYVPADQERSWLRLEHYEKVLQLVASELAHALELPRQSLRGYLEASLADRKLVPELQAPPP